MQVRIQILQNSPHREKVCEFMPKALTEQKKMLAARMIRGLALPGPTPPYHSATDTLKTAQKTSILFESFIGSPEYLRVPSL